MTFEWDVYKAIANVIKHGISFEQAITIFDDDDALLIGTPCRPDTIEKRFQAIGKILMPNSMNELIVSVIYTFRDDGKIWRIISARPASRAERERYDR